MERGLTTIVFITVAVCGMTSAAMTHWRERSEYPKNYGDFELYVTDPATPMTGERALQAGCDVHSRPYKYRGRKHLAELSAVLAGGGRRGRVWVGAVETTTPWVWTNGRYLYQLMGMTSPDMVPDNAVRLPGNNAFLCSLHCRQVSFVLLKGNKCACLKSKPQLLPVSGQLFRCPGTYEEYCGTATSYTVYKNMLAKTVKWARLVDKAQYHGNKAYLYRSPLAEHPPVTLRAEDDPADRKGYICNDTVFAIGPTHIQHLWVAHAQTAAVTWREALEACMNEGKQLMLLPRDAKSCVQEVEKDLEKGQSYWVGLSRRNVPLWLDGTPVKTSVGNHRKGRAACLTMSLTSKNPTFTFESCAGLSLPVLCERNTKSPIHTFTHDAQGNHVITRTSSDDFTDWTVNILVAVLVVLTLLSIVLLFLLYHRDKWIPRRTHSSREPSSGGKLYAVSPTGGSRPTSSRASGVAASASPDKEHVHVLTVQMKSAQRYDPQPRRSYGVAANRGKQPQPPLIGSGNSRPTSASMDYTEVSLPEDGDVSSSADVCRVVVSSAETRPPVPSEVERRPSSLRILDYQMNSSQSSATGSDEPYSVLGYRRSILTAWPDVKRTAYAHVMINQQPTQGQDDQSALYDVAPHVKPPRARCIDNDYDHAEPTVSKAQSLVHPQDIRLVLEAPGRGNDSDV